MDEVSTASFGPPSATSHPESATVRAWTFRSERRGPQQLRLSPIPTAIRLVLAEFQLPEFRVGSYINFGRHRHGPHSRGGAAATGLHPEASAHRDRSNELPPADVSRTRRVYAEAAALLRRHDRGDAPCIIARRLPTDICTERKRPSREPG